MGRLPHAGPARTDGTAIDPGHAAEEADLSHAPHHRRSHRTPHPLVLPLTVLAFLAPWLVGLVVTSDVRPRLVAAAPGPPDDHRTGERPQGPDLLAGSFRAPLRLTPLTGAGPDEALHDHGLVIVAPPLPLAPDSPPPPPPLPEAAATPSPTTGPAHPPDPTPTPVAENGEATSTPTAMPTTGPTPTREVDATPTPSTAPTATPSPTAPGRARDVSAAALDRISFPWRAALPGWTVRFETGAPRLGGFAAADQRLIQVSVADGDRIAAVARVLAHELGHALDMTLNDTAARREWKRQRGIPPDAPWWASADTSDRASGAGDLAECFAAWQVGSSSRSVWGRCSAEDLTLLREMFRR